MNIMAPTIDYCQDCGNSAWMFVTQGVRVCTDCYDRRNAVNKTEATRSVIPAHKVTVDEYLATGASVEVALVAHLEPMTGLILDYNHLGLLLAHTPAAVCFYPWATICRVTEAE